MACYNSVAIKAPADLVWKTVRDFHGMAAWAPNVVQSCAPEGDKKGTELGAQRVLNDMFRETLLGIDDRARMMRYSIDDGPEALSKDNVSGYVGELKVFPVTADNTSFVLWTSSWDRGGGVAEFCNPIYQALLSELKKTLEGNR